LREKTKDFKRVAQAYVSEAESGGAVKNLCDGLEKKYVPVPEFGNVNCSAR
jgi:hypothetical protein